MNDSGLLNKTNILIVGAGAIGLLWYSHLYLNTRSHTNTHLFQSSSRRKVPSEIHFTNLQQQTSVIPTQSFEFNAQHESLSKPCSATFDIILICVKSYQLNDAINEVFTLITPNTLIITSHNGLGAMNTQYSKALANHNILNLLTTHGCLKTANNKITHTGVGVSDLGVQLGSPPQTLINHTTSLFNQALPTLSWCNTLLEKQWTKLAINCVINPLTALFNVENGKITDITFNNTIDLLLSEIVEVSAASGLALNQETLKNTVIGVAKKTAKNSSSMRCDVLENRMTEIEYINGYIHHQGQALGINTQKNTELYQGVLALHPKTTR